MENTTYNQFEENLGNLVRVLKAAHEASDDEKKQAALTTAERFFEMVKEDIGGAISFVPPKSSSSLNESKLDKAINNYKRLF